MTKSSFTGWSHPSSCSLLICLVSVFQCPFVCLFFHFYVIFLSQEKTKTVHPLPLIFQSGLAADAGSLTFTYCSDALPLDPAPRPPPGLLACHPSWVVIFKMNLQLFGNNASSFDPLRRGLCVLIEITSWNLQSWQKLEGANISTCCPLKELISRAVFFICKLRFVHISFIYAGVFWTIGRSK